MVVVVVAVEERVIKTYFTSVSSHLASVRMCEEWRDSGKKVEDTHKTLTHKRFHITARLTAAVTLFCLLKTTPHTVHFFSLNITPELKAPLPAN